MVEIHSTDKTLANMDVFVMVRRKQSTIFIDAKESTTILELKRMIQGILKVRSCSSFLVFLSHARPSTP